jgi:hypothetical protein
MKLFLGYVDNLRIMNSIAPGDYIGYSRISSDMDVWA